jgi:rhodanese-related sulfurtransferase
VVNEINAPELEKKLSTGNEVFLLDIRSATEVASGVLPKAQHIPMHLLPLRLNEFPKDRDVVLYCHSGSRSYHACMYLMQQGFRNVVNLRGGILDWARSGYHVVAPAC